MKVFACNKLTHTLQTYLGMIQYDGAPQQRPSAQLPKYLLDSERIPVPARRPYRISETELVSLFTSCVLECRLPQFQNLMLDDDTLRLNCNIHACCDLYTDVAFMKTKVVALDRLDLEQAAALVISAVRKDSTIVNRTEVVSSLIQELDQKLLTRSCMWLERHQWTSRATVNEAKLANVVSLLQRMYIKTDLFTECKKPNDGNPIKDWQALLPLLLRVRRCSPRNRCLFIPQWIFDAAGMEVPLEFAVWDSQGKTRPGHEPVAADDSYSDEKIILGRKAFRALQRKLLRYQRFWKPEIRLRKAITDLEANVIYSTDRIKSMVLPSQNTLVVAHYFFALQRRLQRKLVSDLHWVGFLAKGDSGNIMQNNIDIPTSFEQRLSDLSGQTGIPITGPILPQIDQCCLLMEEYVSVYGNGDKTNLVFTPGSWSGSGRGAVDDYNLLCDVLKTLCKEAKEQGLAYPGPVRKFLAKDIMAYNNSFGDDAFANGRIPGWETWLAQRKENVVLGGIEGLKISEDTVMRE